MGIQALLEPELSGQKKKKNDDEWVQHWTKLLGAGLALGLTGVALKKLGQVV